MKYLLFLVISLAIPSLAQVTDSAFVIVGRSSASEAVDSFLIIDNPYEVFKKDMNPHNCFLFKNDTIINYYVLFSRTAIDEVRKGKTNLLRILFSDLPIDCRNQSQVKFVEYLSVVIKRRVVSIDFTKGKTLIKLM